MIKHTGPDIQKCKCFHSSQLFLNIRTQNVVRSFLYATNITDSKIVSLGKRVPKNSKQKKSSAFQFDVTRVGNHAQKQCGYPVN